ncbi:unnamed protein product [Lactuca saligna]|uniref:beta-galactosidase n=1 Tax=Lactuca saligna TaxID=75948 RepID=A0AA35YHI6_LACSI|nr:unnamed protein product [Lactuca saligna]
MAHSVTEQEDVVPTGPPFSVDIPSIKIVTSVIPLEDTDIGELEDDATQQLPADVSQVYPHSVVHGYICNIINTGCFVRFIGRLTGFAPKNKAIDDQRFDLSEVFFVGQVVRSNILEAFIEKCLVPATERSSAGKSLEDPFLKEATPRSLNFMEIDQSVCLNTKNGVAEFKRIHQQNDFRLKGIKNDDNSVSLTLRIADPCDLNICIWFQGLLKENANGSKYWAYGGDFGDSPNELNICLNGLIWLDQTPHPALNEVKYCYQPIKISFTNGIIKITNTNFFQTTEDLEINWVIEGDGRKLDSGTLSLPTLEFNWVIEGDFCS